MNKNLVYKYYTWLKKYHFGKENGVRRENLARTMGVSLDTQKKVLKTINESFEFHKLVSTSGSIYLCKRKVEVQETLNNTWTNALTLLEKAKKMTQKMERQGQYQFKWGKYYKDFIQVFEEGEKNG